MDLTLKSGADRKRIKALWKELKQRMKRQKRGRPFDAYKYKGKIHLDKDPLQIQKEIRDEWNRNFG